jgi:calmodulin-lysine N-methyltransferase
VLELGSGYGLAGLVIAASANAEEVVISDGNPQVVGCILYNQLYKSCCIISYSYTVLM